MLDLSLVALLLNLAFIPIAPITTPAGVTIEDVAIGEGCPAQLNDRVTINFTASTPEGKELASSERRGLPYTFLLDDKSPGYFKLIAGMAEGGERLVEVGPDMAHGVEGVPPLLPGSRIVFRIKLMKVVPPVS